MEMIANSFTLKVFRELEAAVEETSWGTLLGKPGDGKSATAAHLMLQYRDKDFEPIFVSSPQDWKTLVSANPLVKQFIIIDDIFGTSYTDKRKVDEWISMIEHMERIVNERKGNLKVVCTSRRYIFKDVEEAFAKFACFRKISVVDMTDKANQLSEEEKLTIFNKYADKHNIKVDEASIPKIRQFDPPHGFPHCVELFCTNAFLRKSGFSFFKNPTECVQKEIYNLKNNHPFKFFILLLMLLDKTRVNERYIEQMINNPSDDENRLFRTTGINRDTAYPHIVKAAEALKDTYLKQDIDKSYTFTHESLKENVALVYTAVNPTHAVEILSLQQIISYANRNKCDSMKGGSGELADLPLPSDILVEKITEEILFGSIDTVCSCDAWSNEKFVSEWLRYITCESYRVPNCVLKVFLQHIFCFRKGFLIGLLRCNMKPTVQAILENEILVENLGKVPAWTETLQLALDIECTETKTICIDIIRSILASRPRGNAKRLRGSRAVCAALKQSNVECAKLLIQESQLIPSYSGFEGGYFHYLAMSDIPINDFNAISDLLIALGANVNQKREFREVYSPIHQCILKMSLQDNYFDSSDRLVCLCKKGADINTPVYYYGGRKFSGIVSFVLH